MSIEVPHHLIKSVKKGDRQAFGKLIDSCSQYVYAVALKLTGDTDDAQDAAQECFIKVWEKIATYNSHFKFTTWLYKIVANTCLDKLRKQHRENSVFELAENLENLDWLQEGHAFEEEQYIEFIWLVSGNLSRKQHAVFVLHDLEELSQEEISKILGMSKGRVKSNLYYARKAIRQLLITADKEKIPSNYEV